VTLVGGSILLPRSRTFSDHNPNRHKRCAQNVDEAEQHAGSHRAEYRQQQHSSQEGAERRPEMIRALSQRR